MRNAPPWSEALSFSLLDAGERRKALTFRREPDRSRYIAAHAALRLLLAAHLECHPIDVLFGREPCARCGGSHGRPVLLDRAAALHFSLSHSPGLSLVAVAGVPVGVDAERVPGRRTVELCLERLHPEERREALAVPEGERLLWFCRLWARKEAYLKALGTGLGRGLERDYLGDREGPGAPPRPSGWTVRNLPYGPLNGTHSAALAVPAGTRVPGGPRELNWRVFQDDLQEQAAVGRW
ncbi:4'-phosphopantetheinyl transferase superfamily protein [Streptomyces sp. TG1A-60]|uniref:4'-phosphopantetheinyl transferase family protein n=1 Tax=Streptomyces sp. TG1A-60 TaxID=3129111 RepID=UPI0030CE13EE